jgi:hypothetical protein
MKSWKSISKNERWAKLSQKIEVDTVFKRLKDGRKCTRKSRCHDDTKSERWAKAYQKLKDDKTIRKTERLAKLSLKTKRLLNTSE